MTRRLPAAVEARLSGRYDVRLNADDKPLDSAQLRAAMTDYDALIATVSVLLSTR